MPVTSEIPRAYNFAADILSRNLAAGRANKPAFIDSKGSWTYGQLAERVDRFGAALRAKGVRREERILLCMLDTIDWPTAFLGALKAGVVAIPVNTLMTEADYEFMLADSRVTMLVVSDALYPKFEKLIANGSMTKAGLAKIEAAKADGSWETLDAVDAMVMPPDLQKALAKNRKAKKHFDAFPPSSRKMILYWIGSARMDKTRNARIEKTIELAEKNIRANQPQK